MRHNPINAGSLMCALAFCAVIALAKPAFADDGIAFDTIEEANPITSTFPKGTFEQDFQLAMHPGNNCTASVLRRYMTSDRERIDDSCHKVTLIVDCKARTVMQSYQESKTYGIKSFDAPIDPRYAAAVAEDERMHAKDPKIGNVITEDRRRLSVDRYSTDRRQTLTSPAPFGTLSSHEFMTYTFSIVHLPQLRCIDVAAPYIAQFIALDQYMPELSRGFFQRRALDSSTIPNEVTESGPNLPQWRIVLSATGSHAQTQTNASGFIDYFKIESGHIRSILTDDRVFDVPNGYTKSDE